MTRETVLVIDDSRMARMILRSVIEELRPEWTVVEAANADDALAEAEARPPDTITLDIGLPGMSGLELAAKLRQLYPSAAMAVITSNIQKPVRERALALGAAFIHKPLEAGELVAFLSQTEDRND